MPADWWWQSIVLWIYNTGLRIENTILATWDMVDRDEPNWITIPRSIYKGRSHGHFLFVNPWARAAIERIRSPALAQLFPWLHWPTSASWLQRSFRRIVERSGLPPHRRFSFHALRGACGSQLGRINGTAADLVLGHRGRNLRIDCYTDPQVMVEPLMQLPQPRFVRQRTLF